MLVTTRKPFMDSGWRNIARRVPANCVLSLPGLPEGRSIATIPDISGQGNHGTITGAKWVKNSKGLYVLDFNGTTDFIQLANDINTIGVTTTGTFLAWVKADVSTGTRSIIYDYKNTVPTNGLAFRFNATNTIEIFANNANVQSFDVTTVATIDTTDYHLISARFDTSNVYIDIDGVNSISAAVVNANGIGASGLNTHIGRYFSAAGAASLYWDGVIALPRIFNRALPLTEVVSHYNQERHLFP